MYQTQSEASHSQGLLVTAPSSSSFSSSAANAAGDGINSKVLALRAEVYQLKASEVRKLNDCKELRASLAEGWSKLVSLRGYVTKFRREIEECVLEDISNRTEHSDSRSSVTTPSSSSSISRAEQLLAEKGYKPANEVSTENDSDADGERAEVLELHRRRATIRERVSLSEGSLITLRSELEAAAAQLLASRQHTKETDSTRSKSSIEYSLQTRKAVLDLSKKLEAAETEYFSAIKDLEELESALSRTLKDMADKPVADKIAVVTFTSRSSISNREAALNMSDLDTIAGDIKPIVRVDIGSIGVGTSGKGGRQMLSFTVDEVVDGRAAIARLNGETAQEYCSRLQSRLAMLVALDSSVVTEVEEIRMRYQACQKDAKDVEFNRIRAELQLSNLEKFQVQQRLEMVQNGQQLESSVSDESVVVRSILRSNLQSNPDGGQSRVLLSGRKNVAFTDDGDMVVKQTAAGTVAVATVNKLNDLASPIHSPYDRNGRRQRPSSIPRLSVLTTPLAESKSSSANASSAGRTPARRTPGTVEGAIDRLDRMASLLEMQFRMFALGSSLNEMTSHCDDSEVTESDTTVSSSGKRQGRSPTVLFPGSPKRSPTSPGSIAPTGSVTIPKTKEQPTGSTVSLANGINLTEFMKEFGELKEIIKLQMVSETPIRNGSEDTTSQSQGSVSKETKGTPIRRGNVIPSITKESSVKKQQSFLEVRRSGGEKKSEPLVPWHKRRPFDLPYSEKEQEAKKQEARKRQQPSKGVEQKSKAEETSLRSRSLSPSRLSPTSLTSADSTVDRRIRSPSMGDSPSSRYINQVSPNVPPSTSRSHSPNKIEYAQGIVEILPATKRSPSPTKVSLLPAKLDDKSSPNGSAPVSSDSGGDVSEKLSELERQLVECKRAESFDAYRGVSIDKQGNSIAFLAVTIISARNIVAMKKLTKTSDPYVEITLTPHSYSLTQRTTTCWNDLFPKWNETITFRRIDHVDQSCGVLLTVRDAVKRTTGDDAIIGSCSIPFTLLMDQRKHQLTLPLVMPEKRPASLPIMIDGSLRVEARLVYMRSRLLQERIDEIRQSLGLGEQLSGSVPTGKVPTGKRAIATTSTRTTPSTINGLPKK